MKSNLKKISLFILSCSLLASCSGFNPFKQPSTSEPASQPTSQPASQSTSNVETSSSLITTTTSISNTTIIPTSASPSSSIDSNTSSTSTTSENPVDQEEIKELFNELEDIEENIDEIADEVVEDVSGTETVAFDCDEYFTFNIVTELTVSQIPGELVITDFEERSVPYNIEYLDGNIYKISGKEKYIPGEHYSVTVGDHIFFENKDEKIKNFNFAIKRESENKAEFSDEINYISVDKLISFPSDVEDSHYFLYKEDVNLNGGDIFCLSSENAPNKDSFISEFDYSERYGDYYKIHFNDPDLSRVYKYLDIDLEEDVNLDEIESQIISEDELKEQIMSSDAMRSLEQKLTSFSGKRSFGDLIKLQPSITQPTSSSVKVSLVAKLKCPINSDGLYLHAKFMFSREYAIKVKSNVQIKRTWLLKIPYGVSADVGFYLREEAISSIQLGLMQGPGEDPDFFKSSKEKMHDTIEKLKNSASHSKPYAEWFPDDSPSENKLKATLVTIIFPIGGILDFRISIGLEMKIDLYGLAGITRKEVREDFIGGYNTSSGFKSASQPTHSESFTDDILIAGKAAIRVGPFVSLSLSLFGLNWLLSVSLSGTIGPQFSVNGYYFVNGSGSHGGLYVKISWNYEITFKVTVCWISYTKSWSNDIWSKTTYYGCFNIDFWFEENYLFYLNEDIKNLKDSGALDIMRYDPVDEIIHKARYNPQTGLIDTGSQGHNVNNNEKYTFKFTILSGSQYFKLDSYGNITYKNNPLHFLGSVQVKMTGTNFNKTYEAHFEFTSKDAVYVSFDGSEYYYRLGTTLTFSSLPDKEDQIFRYWTDPYYQKYYAGESIVLTNYEYYFASVYTDAEYFTVNFYNGNNVLISSQLVREGSDAVEPSDSEVFMPGYDFLGWDRDFTNVYSNIDVYGIYARLS